MRSDGQPQGIDQEVTIWTRSVSQPCLQFCPAASRGIAAKHFTHKTTMSVKLLSAIRINYDSFSNQFLIHGGFVFAKLTPTKNLWQGQREKRHFAYSVEAANLCCQSARQVIHWTE